MSVLKLSPSSQPASASTGEIYYDSSSNKLKFYNGSKWLTVTINREYETAGATIDNTAKNGYDLIVFTAGDGTSSYKFKPTATLNIDLLIVAAGGGTGQYRGGGGGGQVITHTGISVSSGAEYYITVGTGSAAVSGGNSFFKHSDGSTIEYRAIGGGKSDSSGLDGGSGGGHISTDSTYSTGASIKDTSHTSFSGGTINNYGNAGGNHYATASPYGTGGGGGAGSGQVGGNSTSSQAGNGGNGIDVSSTFGTAYGDSGIFGGGGGGMIRQSSGFGTGGSGGGGRGGNNGGNGQAGTANTGGGAGGQGESGSNLAGGSGIVIIRVAR